MTEWVNPEWQHGESDDETLAYEILARSPRRNRRRRHCRRLSVLCFLGPNGSDRVDGDKLCALLVGSHRDPGDGSRPGRSDGAAVSGFGIAASYFWRS